MGHCDSHLYASVQGWQLSCLNTYGFTWPIAAPLVQESLSRDLPLAIYHTGIHMQSYEKKDCLFSCPSIGSDIAVDPNDFRYLDIIPLLRVCMESEDASCTQEASSAFSTSQVTHSWLGRYEFNAFDQNAIVGLNTEMFDVLFCTEFSGHESQQVPACGEGPGAGQWSHMSALSGSNRKLLASTNINNNGQDLPVSIAPHPTKTFADPLQTALAPLELKVRALVRDASKGAAITKEFSQVQLVTGGLDDAEVIAQEARDADIVLNLAATGHLKSVQTIYDALSNKPKGAKPPYYIQISGASALAAGELADKSRVFGTGSDVIYNDLTGIDSIKSLIKQHPSRAVDNYIFSVSEQNSHVKTALVVPPIIYGQGRGPGNQRSVQIPSLARATLERKKGLQVGPGESRWGNIHIADLSRIFLSLVEKAVEGNQDENIWGASGVFFTGAGELSFAEISRRVAVAANDFNLIPSTEIDSLDGKEIDSIIPHGSVLLGTNARAGADRAKKVLGWQPERESLEEHIPSAVIQEAEALGIKEKEKKPYDKLASLHPDWPWFFTVRGADRHMWWEQECLERSPDDFDLYIYNNFGCSGGLEMFETIIFRFNSVFKPDS
ncbi:nucleoside-diphosphate-sugar epimerase [Fusarium beomiforme]|uniref:Nucleoside-diphosphate-sugar epimerase n=1 Tax=Fusarium beomiforme TaxID=44412 RepID=A0A9P5AKH7_9HYPO|nr:nucleoside-diphosphate-sugar epimerase [Fusarium beomiforme]